MIFVHVDFISSDFLWLCLIVAFVAVIMLFGLEILQDRKYFHDF